MITTAHKLSMQRAIAQKLSFFEWWKVQAILPDTPYTKDIAHIEYDTQEGAYQAHLKRFKQSVVTDSHGVPKERFEIKLFNTPEDAYTHGCRIYGKKRFRIIPFTDFKRTATYRRIIHLIELKNKAAKFNFNGTKK